MIMVRLIVHPAVVREQPYVTYLIRASQCQ